MALSNIYDLFDEAKDEAMQWFQGEIATLRTNRVTANLIERIPIEHYGSRTPLQGLASVSNADARTLVISSWDPGAIESIEKSLTEANLGVQPQVDGGVVRLVFPSLTDEMRERTVKTLHQRAEEARVRLRQARDEALKLLKEEKEAGEVTEDDFYDGKKKLDELIEQANSEIEHKAEKREADIRVI